MPAVAALTLQQQVADDGEEVAGLQCVSATETVGWWPEQGFAGGHAVSHHVEEAAHADAEQEEDGGNNYLQLNTNP